MGGGPEKSYGRAGANVLRVVDGGTEQRQERL